jgi:spermidine synthase
VRGLRDAPARRGALGALGSLGALASLGASGAGRAIGAAAAMSIASEARAAGNSATAQPLPQGATLLESADSPFSAIRVYEIDGARLMAFDGQSSGSVQSAWLPADPGALLVPYTRLMTLALAYADRHRKAVIVGLGGGRTAGYLAATFAPLEVHAVEIDPQVTRLAQRWFDLRTGPRLSVTHEDGRRFIERLTAPVDLVFVDAYLNDSAPRHLTTRQFYEAIRDRLAPGGAMALNIEPHSQALGDALLTIEAVFGHYDTYGDGNNVVLITRRGPALDAGTLETRARALDTRFSPRHGLHELLAARQPLTPAPGARIRTDA